MAQPAARISVPANRQSSNRRVTFAPRVAPRESRLARYVPYLVIGLPALALLVVMAGLVYPLIVAEGGFRLGAAPMAKPDAAYSVMNNPQFTGSDTKGRNFNLSAVAAHQLTAESPVLDLQSPKGDITLSSGNWVSLTADSGKFEQKLRQLDVVGNVMLFHDNGYQLTTEQAHIDLKTGEAHGEKPVHGQGPDGIVDAEGFRVTGYGERIVFTGKTEITFYDGNQTLPDGGATQ
jgi:lipopolysaccharide export system protein LptC